MKSKCLEARTIEFGLIRRRRLREDGVRFTTIEIPIEIWSTYYRRGNKGKDLMESWLRRRDRMAKRIEAQSCFTQGWKLDAIEQHIGINARTLSDWRRKWKATLG